MEDIWEGHASAITDKEAHYNKKYERRKVQIASVSSWATILNFFMKSQFLIFTAKKKYISSSIFYLGRPNYFLYDSGRFSTYIFFAF